MSKRITGRQRLAHEFVEFVPEVLKEGVLYVSTTYATTAHRCFCGCGREVVTPLSPTDWQLTFDGETVSLTPSVGNWSLPCRSHYWIDRNRVEWAGDMPQGLIDAGRARDRRLKADYFRDRSVASVGASQPAPQASPRASERRPGWWSRVTTWLRGG